MSDVPSETVPAGQSIADDTSKPADRNRASRSRRLCGFVCDVIALGALIATIGTAIAVGVAAWHDGDVTEVHGTRLQLAAAYFFIRVFQYHLGGAVLVCALVAWLVRHRRIALFNLAVAGVLLLPLGRAYLPKSPPPVVGGTLRVYSANLYSYNRDGAAIVNSIRAANPDVIVVIEVTPWSHELLTRAFGGEYKYIHRPHYQGGGMVLSRVPFREDPPVVRLPSNHSRVPLVFSLGGREFAMYSVHLISPGNLGLIAEHREQMREFLMIEASETRPMMIVGDCNMTPRTPNFGALRNAGFRSTYELIGFGACNTWGPRWWPRLNRLPGVQIDQMLMQPPLTATSHHVGLDTGSDHRPIVAEIGFAEEK